MDGDVIGMLSGLQESVRKRGIPCREFHCDWHPEGITENTHGEFLKPFSAVVAQDLEKGISEAIKCQPHFDECVTEVASHVQFCHEKARTFHGREGLVNSFRKDYSEPNKASNTTKVIFGVSGSGKTSLMAKLVHDAQKEMELIGKNQAVFVTRFCGITPQASSARALLESMSEQIIRAYSSIPEVRPQGIPTDYRDIVEYFREKCLSLADSSKPLFIHIDSLDQLSDADNGRRKPIWLPVRLPPYVDVTVSIVPDVGGCLAALRLTGIPDSSYTEIPTISHSDSRSILTGWLQSCNRKLTQEQTRAVEAKAVDESEETPTALRLKLLFDVAVKWTSFEKIPELSSSVHGLINMIFNEMEKTHGRHLVASFCGLIGVSKLGLPENEDPGFSKWGGAVLSQMGGRTSCFQVKSA